MRSVLPHDLERLRLRALRIADLDAFHAYRSDPEVARYQGWAPMTAAQAAEFLRRHGGGPHLMPGTWRQWAIADLRSDRLLGDAGVWLSPDAAQAGFGLSITPAAQGNGYGTECMRGLIGLLFSATPVMDVTASTDHRNAPCLAALARAGMRRVDTRQVEYKGEACTEQVFAVRRPATGRGRAMRGRARPSA